MTTLPEDTFAVAPLGPLQRVPADLETALDLACGRVVALLDAAAMPGLVEIIAAEDGPARDAVCLWDGAAAADLADVAPWLVPLGPDSDVLRYLMTAPSPADEPQPWACWGHWPGLLLRARDRLDALRAHLRRMTRIPEDGRIYHLRVWEPSTAAAFWRMAGDRPDHLAWKFGEAVEEVIYPADGPADAPALARVVAPPNLARGARPADALAVYRTAFRALRWRRFCDRIFTALGAAGPPYADVTRDEVRRLCDGARAAGYRSEAEIWAIVRAGILARALDRDVAAEGRVAWHGRSPPDRLAAARLLLARLERLAAAG